MTMPTEQLTCTSCRKPKAQVKLRKSKALPGAQMYLCGDCIDNKREPRGFLVLAGREYGLDHISFWIKPPRYCGEPITVRELT